MPASSLTDERRRLRGVPDEFTGDPRIRDLWDKSRHERHVIIRSMHGDLWVETSWLSRMGTIVGTGALWLVAVPLLWAGMMMLSFLGVAVVIALGDLNQPVAHYLGTGGSGGLGDIIVWGSLVVSVFSVSYLVRRKIVFREREIRHLRGLSNRDLLKAHERWRQQKAREAEAARRGWDAWERRREADYLAKRIGEEMRRR